MLQICNRTPFATDLATYPDENGVDSTIAVLKATFEIVGDAVRVCSRQAAIVKTDQYWGAPGKSSVKYASEISLPKPNTDIVMIGHASAPEGKAALSLLVGLKVGQCEKKALVFGDRYRESSIGLCSETKPVPFKTMPLIYENAFGGFDSLRSDPGKTDFEPGNPVGCGFRMKNGKNELSRSKLPNIEDPDRLISGGQDRPAPAGFGYIAPDWAPRRNYAGTYDEKWRKNRAPFLPVDFDRRFFNCAHPDLIADGYLKGNEQVIVKNVGRYGVTAFHVPMLRFQFIFNIDRKTFAGSPHLDTLIIEPDQNRFSVIWRSCMPCDKKTLKIRKVEFICTESSIDLEDMHGK